MSELNMNITKNSITSQNLGINILSNTNVKSQNKNPSFHKVVSNFIEQRLHPKNKKQSWTRDLLIELTNEPTTFKSTNDLGKSTSLDNVVYPILAKLHRQGLVETKQCKDGKGTILTYRLTEEGFIHSKAVVA